MQKGVQLFHIVPIYVRTQGKHVKRFFSDGSVKPITESPKKISSVIEDLQKDRQTETKNIKYFFIVFEYYVNNHMHLQNIAQYI